MLSVIIPIYNVKNYLDRCLESVVRQTYQDMEIILVDDASTDGSDIICDSWREKDSRIRVIHKAKNAGHGPARNTGVEESTGSLLAFLDADDWWEPDYAEKMILLQEKYQADMVICDIWYESGSKKELSEIRMEAERVYCPTESRNLINVARTFLWGKLYRMAFYKQLEISQPSLGFDDLAVVPYIVAKAAKLVRCPKPLYHYLRHREGNTVDNEKYLEEIPQAIEYLIKMFVNENLYEEFECELERLAFSQVRVAAQRSKKCNKDYVIRRLIAFMDREFSGWFNPYKKKYAVANQTMREIISLLMFEDDQVHILTADQMKDNKILNSYNCVLVDMWEDIHTPTQQWDAADKLYELMREGRL